MRARFVLAAAAAICVVHPAAAQVVNYAELQDVLGEPVTTSVIGKPQRASGVTASLTIITRDDIRRSPARSVPDLLKAYAGVEVNRWTAGQNDVAVRGGVQTYNARLLVLVNGRQVYLDHYGMTDWNLLGIQLEDIQQIELVRGPASALFGFNAASGVVNIITVDPLAAHGASVDVEGGDHGQRRIGGSLFTALAADIGLRLSGGHSEEDERAVPDTIEHPPLRGVRADAISGQLSIRADPATQVDLEGGWAYNRQLEFLPAQYLLEQTFRSANAGVTVDHDTGWGSVTGRAFTNWLDAIYGSGTTPYGPPNSITSFALRNRITVAQASTLVRLGGNNTARLGGEFRDNQLFSDAFFSHRLGYRNLAVSGTLDLHPTDHLAVSVAARLDRLSLGQGGAIQQPAVNDPRDFRRIITEPSFNLGMVADLGAAGQLRVNGGRGVQSPSLVNFGAHLAYPLLGAPLPLYVAGDPGIHPAIVWSGEVGFAHAFGAALKLDGALFYTRNTDAISPPGALADFDVRQAPVPVGAFRFKDAGAFAAYGVQVGASGRAGTRLGWTANYTWVRTSLDYLPGVQPFTVALSPRDTTPTHVATVGVDYAIGRWSLAANAHYTSRTRQLFFILGPDDTVPLVNVPQAILVDAKLAVRIGRHLTAYAAGENLGAARGAYGSPIPGDRRLRAGLKFDL